MRLCQPRMAFIPVVLNGRDREISSSKREHFRHFRSSISERVQLGQVAGILMPPEIPPLIGHESLCEAVQGLRSPMHDVTAVDILLPR